MRSVTQIRVGLAALCVVGLTATACGGTSSSGGDQAKSATCGSGPLTTTQTVKLGVNPGAQDLITFVMEQQGFAEKHKLKLDIKKFQNPSALHTAIGEKVVDVGFGGLTAMAVARANRRGAVIFNILTGPSNIVFAPKNSSLQSFGDLKGHKLGAFGGRGSATFGIQSVVAKEVYGIDNMGKEMDVLDAPDSALMGLLDQGKVDAALLGTTATVQALLSGKYKVLSDMSADYEKKFGRPPGHVTVASNDGYAAKNCEVLRAFSGALADSLKFIQGDEKVWGTYAQQIKITDPRAAQMLKDRVGSRYITKWDQAQVDAETQLIQRLIGVLGKDAFVAETPKGLFRLDLQPAP
ncbi:ABC transporter substrate-binding protein [Actinomadura sp. HBU206391]|uniref:ABC transporter substrate-binding protein n=1 Tax=Actinomadura sp. HBU206391 TaxID=2731692 RepID=UPI00164F3004|nr:ABC transporter substrate-binding protein [Actinomadura sp. HBU206391]MBC6461053.1 ABC transporter substrate-binding protein [Actinomadura sp. HBU206391]